MRIWKKDADFNCIIKLQKTIESYPDEHFLPLIERIEKELQQQENFVKDAMNNALWSIGMRYKELNKRCISDANIIGK